MGQPGLHGEKRNSKMKIRTGCSTDTKQQADDNGRLVSGKHPSRTPGTSLRESLAVPTSYRGARNRCESEEKKKF
jgi:hypothetical protein